MNTRYSTVRRLLATLALTACSLSAPAVHAQSYDVVSQFGYNSNPAGVWSYGSESQTTTGPDAPVAEPNPTSFSLLTTPYDSSGFQGWTTPTDFPIVAVNLGTGSPGNVAPGQLTIHPDNSENAGVVRWTSPITGLVNIDGQFYPGDSGIEDVALQLDGRELFSANDSGSFDQNVLVKTGDTVDFTVTEGPNGYGYGNTPLAATITVLPEPASLVAMAAVACFGLQKRRRSCPCST